MISPTQHRAAGPTTRRRNALFNTLFTVLFLALLTPATADCECGYSSIVGGTSGETRLFTDLLETDFTRVTDMGANTDWGAQAWNRSAAASRGRLGELFEHENVVPNPSRTRGGPGQRDGGSTAGVDLMVRSAPVDGLVPVAELDSIREDILWGSFRAGIKLAPIKGTCAAFFWYFNDTMEIDMEFLTGDFDPSNNSFPVNLVLQSRAAAAAGYDASATGNFKKVNLGFDPTARAHEYRIDFLPGRVVFYADGRALGEMSGAAVPDHAGHLILQHWSNGNPLWSGGPPEKDAAMTVAYVRAYFNSSAEARRRDWEGRCADPKAPGAVCVVPDAVDVGEPWMFSAGGNMTNNQSVSVDGMQQQRSTGAGTGTGTGTGEWRWLGLGMPVAVVGLVLGVW